MMLRPPLAPMLARAVDALPAVGACPGSCRWEPKFDGWRCLAFHQPGGVYLQSRAGRRLSEYFPEVCAAVETAAPGGVVLDGELVVWEQQALNFARLGQRITAGAGLGQLARDHPAHYVAFDLLQDPTGRQLLDLPLERRRAMLADLLASAPQLVTLCPQTTDLEQARWWLTAWTVAGIEGVVAKGATSRYRPGRRGWLKYRPKSTTLAIIGGVTGTLNRPETVLVARCGPTGVLRLMGLSHPLRPAQQRELQPLLHPPAPPGVGGLAHRWPQPLPAGWVGHFQGSDPLPYRPVLPVVVAQIAVDTAFEHRRWRHRVHYQNVRSDLSVDDVPLLSGE
jgi:ATP-dependent DNA ligase